MWNVLTWLMRRYISLVKHLTGSWGRIGQDRMQPIACHLLDSGEISAVSVFKGPRLIFIDVFVDSLYLV